MTGRVNKPGNSRTVHSCLTAVVGKNGKEVLQCANMCLYICFHDSATKRLEFAHLHVINTPCNNPRGLGVDLVEYG